ncbi:MAG: UTP--glucose-1-phosphate uridylyltransferase [Corynebacteriales bacterium]|nr:UTP--glucose-1-phosphate uridylyltransferase [Mycobacteriales bacterium]
MPETARSHAISKAVIPVAGAGTRFLPATKAVPKVLLPVVDRPSLEYIVEEASRAGIDDVLLVTGRGQESIIDHFDRSPALEALLEAKGDKARIEAVKHSAQLAAITATRQDEPRGLGHAVLCAASHVGDEPFVVQLGDDIIDGRDTILPAMMRAHAQFGGIVLALLEVPTEHIQRYGCAATTGVATTLDGFDVVAINGLVEKPAPQDAPSNLAVIGRYVLPPEIFPALRETAPGAGNEIQLTDAMAALLAQGVPVHGVVFTGRRYDVGDRGDFLKATVQLAAEREDLGPEFRSWLIEYVNNELKQ